MTLIVIKGKYRLKNRHSTVNIIIYYAYSLLIFNLIVLTNYNFLILMVIENTDIKFKGVAK